MLADLGLVVAGLALLTLSADRFVVSAARLSRLWGLSPILIGAVVVGLGTSLPEMLVSGLAAADPGGLDLALGNVVGSNIANLTLVLGISTLISPMAGQRRIIRREGMAMLVGSAALTGLAWNGDLLFLEGAILAAGMVVALGLLYRWSLIDAADGELDAGFEDPTDGQVIRPNREVLLGIGALALTLLGARLLVDGAKGVAGGLGVSGGLIGLTLVAVGTSLPELATGIAAARRHENDLVLGNVLGSNLFNALAVGGVSAMIGNGQLEADFRGSLLAMLVISAVAGLLSSTQNRLQRWEGALLLAAYPVAIVLARV
ncbi:MAG: calcium/sodium antiporter [Acidimicrobiia bacterium]|jgi:cation:H+ antiporter